MKALNLIKKSAFLPILKECGKKEIYEITDRNFDRKMTTVI